MSKRLSFLHWVFTRETRAWEFWAGLFSLTIGYSFVSGQTILSQNYHIFSWSTCLLGILLILGSIIQLVGLIIDLLHLVTMSYLLRWLGSIIEGSIWAVCSIFTIINAEQFYELKFIYLLFLGQEVFIVMAIAYRGTHGCRKVLKTG